VLDGDALLFHDLLGHGTQLGDLGPQLIDMRYQRNHHLDLDLDTLFCLAAGGLEDGAHLHLGETGHHQAHAAAAQAHHWVHFPHALHDAEHVFSLSQCLRILACDAKLYHFFQQRFSAGQELVHGRIDKADDHGQAVHRLKDALKVLLLEGQELLKIPGTLFVSAGHDHSHHSGAAGLLKEHVLGAAQPDSLRAKGPGASRVARIVRVGVYPEGAGLVCPRQQLGQLLVGRNIRLKGGNLSHKDLAGGAIDGDHVTFLYDQVTPGKAPVLRVDADLLASNDAGHIVAARNHRRMRCRTAMLREHALGHEHTAHIVRGGLGPHEDYGLAVFRMFHGAIRIEHGDTGRGAGRGIQPLSDLVAGGFGPRLGIRVEHRVKQRIHLLSGDAVKSFWN